MLCLFNSFLHRGASEPCESCATEIKKGNICFTTNQSRSRMRKWRKNLGLLSALQQSDLVNLGEASGASVWPRARYRGGKGEGRVTQTSVASSCHRCQACYGKYECKRVLTVLPFPQLSQARLISLEINFMTVFHTSSKINFKQIRNV